MTFSSSKDQFGDTSEAMWLWAQAVGKLRGARREVQWKKRKQKPPEGSEGFVLFFLFFFFLITLYTKGTFHAKMGSIKDRNGMDLTEAEDIKKRWQEYTEPYKKRSSRPR